MVRREHGVTLLETLIILVILAILVAIGVPSFLGHIARTENAAAAANIHQAVTPVRTYYLDNGTFVGMTIAKLRKRYDRGFPKCVAVVSVGADWYCIRSKVGKSTWFRALGVDTHRDEHVLAVVAAPAGEVIAAATAAASGRGYRELLAVAQRLGSSGPRSPSRR